MFSSDARSTSGGRNLVDRAKPFDIPKREVWEAYKRVRANQGTAGVDGESIADFEADLSNNLYKLWNRLSRRRPPAESHANSRSQSGSRNAFCQPECN